MANVLILGGGFAGVVAAERLAKDLSDEHQITLVSHTRHFVFYPALVRLAFGECSKEDVSFDLRKTLLNRRVNFIEAEVARIDPVQRRVAIARGEVEGVLTYDYLIFALGRRLATERVSGFFENANHLLNVDKAIKFGKELEKFREGRIVVAQCAGARLPVAVYETAFALARKFAGSTDQERVKISMVNPDIALPELNSSDVAIALRKALKAHYIEQIFGFPIERVTPDAVLTRDGRAINFDLLMLVPPFVGAAPASNIGITDNDGYINVNSTMRVIGQERMYAIGDCVSFSGPKLAHMAVRQGEIAALNVLAEIRGQIPVSHYVHEMRLVIDEGGGRSLYVHQPRWAGEPPNVKQGHFWRWAKRAQKKYWEATHS